MKWGVLAVGLISGTCCAQQQPECLPCHGVRDFSVQTADGSVVSLHIDPLRYVRSVHGDLLCYQCHTNMAIQPHAIMRIDIRRAVEPYVKKFRRDIRPAAAACITCHEKAFEEYHGSAHAVSLRQGNPDSPYCIDCHGSHYIRGTEDLESQTSPRNVPATCASCHAVGLLMSRYDVATDTYETFQQSVHGRKLALGEPDVAVCTSCHGVHDIRSSADPESRLHHSNITATCRECHKGASREFALSFRHIAPSPEAEPLIYWITAAYRWLIAVIVGIMVIYIGLDLLRRLAEWIRVRREECP